MKRRIGLVLAAAAAIAAVAGNTASARSPGLCDEMLEPAMERYQFFDEDTQAVIDEAAGLVCR